MQCLDDRAELEAFKTEINLSEYAAAQGYALDPKRSTKALAVMRRGDDIIIISRRAGNGYWQFYTVHGADNRGTIIDLVQSRQGLSIGQVRQALRPWIGTDPYRPSLPSTAFAARLEPVTRDLESVRAMFGFMQRIEAHPYLVSRGIPAGVQSSSRFAGYLYQDAKFRNAVFPHYNREGLTGFEIKNQNFTGFAKGGEKSLWRSAAHKGDIRAVFAETAIDALSYAALHDDDCMRYFSTGGAMNPGQPALVAAAAARLPQGGEIILAADHDEGGDKFTASLQAAIREAGRPDLTVRRHSPAQPGTDWNDSLKALSAEQPSFSRPELG